MSKENQVTGSNPEKNENEIAGRDTVGLTQKQIIVKRFVKHKAAMGSLFGLIFIFSQDSGTETDCLAADIMDGKGDAISKAVIEALCLSFFL